MTSLNLPPKGYKIVKVAPETGCIHFVLIKFFQKKTPAFWAGVLLTLVVFILYKRQQASRLIGYVK